MDTRRGRLGQADVGRLDADRRQASVVDELRWLAPVRPGDTLHLEGEVIELIPSRTKPQGVARIRWTALNQRGEPVYSVIPLAIVPRKPQS
jgi:acyl dehydratase